jgi:ribosomal protein S12 methylthiotransferase
MTDAADPTPAPAPGAAPTIGFVSLGCPKALTDSERILTQLRAEGYETSRTFAGAASS